MDGHIAQLNVIDSDLDRRTAHRRAHQILGRLRLRPAGMPAEAILCLRHFEDPLPQTLPLDRRRLADMQRWQRAANNELTRLYREAYSPVRGHVPSSAAAVLFADYADLLACMAADWLAGRLLTRWWWQHWIEHYLVDEAVHRAWLRDPVYVPAALERLAYRSDFVQRLPEGVVSRLAYGIVQAYGLPRALLDHVEDGSSLQSSPEAYAEPASGLAHRMPPTTATPGDLLELRRIQAAIPEHTSPELSIVRRRFLLIALMLIRQPRLARQARFAALARRSLYELVTTEHKTAPQQPEDAPGHAAMTEYIQGAEHSQDQTRTRPDTKSPRLRMIDTDAAAGASLQKDASLPEPDTEQRLLPEYPILQPDTEQRSPTDDVSIQAITTAYGGIFYLVNVALFLKLYGDFSTPREPGLELPIWDFLALIGLEWFADDFRNDPLWPLLAHLAGRSSDTPPGDNVPVPDVWRVPDFWLHTFAGTGVWHWQVADGRLRVKHQEGFLLLDLPEDASLMAELAAYHVPFEIEPVSDMQAEIVTDWAGWLRRLLPYLEARLAQALGHNNVRALCQFPAHISHSETHLNISLRLDDIYLEARQAGLDRNPGWVPAAGRFIHFHFD
jgi:hypothetical protein